MKGAADGYVKDVVREDLGRLVAPVATQVTPKVELSLRPSAIKRESSIPKIMKENDVVKGTITRVEAIRRVCADRRRKDGFPVDWPTSPSWRTTS